MRKIYVLSALVALVILAQCATQVKVEYNIPENLNETQKTELKARLDKGLQLYKPNCSRCHGIFTKGKDSIPNFTAKQISAYKAWHELHDPANHAFAMNMPPEDLDAILNFLLLRKKPTEKQ